MSCIVLQLNILCSNPIKPCYTKMTIHRLFTVYTLRPFYVLSNVLDFIEVEWSIHQNIHCAIGSTKSVMNFAAVRYSLHKCNERILCLKRQLTVHVSPVSRALGFMEARKTCRRVVGTSIWSIPYSGELCNKNYIVKTSETLIVWSASCYTAGSDKSDAIEGVPDRLLKEWRWCLEYIVDTLNCCWPTDVHSQRWLSILTELNAIIERHA